MAKSIYLIICSNCQNDVGVSHEEASPSYVCRRCMEEGAPKRAVAVPHPKQAQVTPLTKRTRQKAPRKTTPLSAKSEKQKKSGAYAIYAIQMRAGVVKVGRTSNWAVRKHSYTHGFDDVLKRCTLFWIIDDFELLPEIETTILQSLWHPRAKGYEWLLADFDEVTSHTDRLLRTNGIMFEREDHPPAE